MNKQSVFAVVVGSLLLAPLVVLLAGERPSVPGVDTLWPTKGWATATSASVGLDEKVLEGLDKDLAAGKFSLVDSFAVFRCGKKVYQRTYAHDYAKIYGKQAKEKGPLNARLTGRYNYFDPDWHPYYHGTDMHTMQSVSKTVTSVIFGVAMNRGDFKAGVDTPGLKFFDVAKVKNVDERKRRSDSGLREATDDWVQYVIDKPMAAEPGKVFNYSSGVTELVAYIFKKETGQDIDDYGEKYLFAPLGIKHQWKRTYMEVIDTEGGLYLNGSDLAKIGYLYLHDGIWDGKQLVSKEWLAESLKGYIDAEGDYKYGYKWWLLKRTDSAGYVWMARGFGGQRMMVFPEEGLIVTFTGWDIIGDPPADKELSARLLPALKSRTCGGAAH